MKAPPANLLDTGIAWAFPGWALARAQARARLAVHGRQYEATNPGTDRKMERYSGSANRSVQSGAISVRQQTRHLERNHDLVRGGLSALVRNTIGAHGIQVEPQPRRLDGSIHDEFAETLRGIYADYSLRPEVTWQHDWPAGQRLLGRSWYRDGEVFAQKLEGNVAGLDHGSRVPFSLELLEADMVPLDFSEASTNTIQGIELNQWGRPRAMHVYRQHPGDLDYTRLRNPDLKRVPAARMLHLAARDRIGQVRGVSMFASVLARFDRLKDYEESEAIAAKVAASMAAFITKGTPELYNPESSPDKRDMHFVPGMIFDDLVPGEEIGTIDSNRPNPNVEAHRAGQLRAAAAGIETGGSTLSKDYRGTFSSMRQELVEQWAAYAILGADFSGTVVRPVYRAVVNLSFTSGLAAIPADVDPLTVFDALYSPVSMPWIDPEKEANAWETLKNNGLASAIEIIRMRGRAPKDVVDQIARWQRMLIDAGVQPMPGAAPGSTEPATDQDQNERDEANAVARF